MSTKVEYKYVLLILVIFTYSQRYLVPNHQKRESKNLHSLTHQTRRVVNTNTNKIHAPVTSHHQTPAPPIHPPCASQKQTTNAQLPSSLPSSLPIIHKKGGEGIEIIMSIWLERTDRNSEFQFSCRYSGI